MLFKYSSLGNKFLLFDGRAQKQKLQADSLCAQYAVDGLLQLQAGNRVSITNRDGSDGALCLNGIRCVAHYLFAQGNEETVTLCMGGKEILCRKKEHTLSMVLPLGKCSGTREVEVEGRHCGEVVEVGNPHFIVFEQASSAWLERNGPLFEQHPAFPERINTSFVWQTCKDRYEMLVYERGCGLTRACSSAALALITILCSKEELPAGQEVHITMPGGVVITYHDGKNNAHLMAQNPLLIGTVNSS